MSFPEVKSSQTLIKTSGYFPQQLSWSFKMLSIFQAAAVLAFVSSARAAPPVVCNADTFPTQIRLAYQNDRGMAVSWNTKVKLSKPVVSWGLDQSLKHSSWSSVSTTYQSSTTWNNHVELRILEPDTLYYYRPVCGDVTYNFTTALTKGKGKPYQFAMVGDMGTFGPDGLSTTVGKGAANPLKPGDLNTIQSLGARINEFDLVWHVGDIAYADTWLKEENQGYVTPLNTSDFGMEYEKILNDFYDQIEVISAVKPYMVAVGNHEANCDNGANITICPAGQLNFTGYRQHWNMPSDLSGGLENFWYSFDHGMVHYITFNTETDFLNAPDQPGGSGNENGGPFAPNGTQLAWLKNDLAKVDRKRTPWVIAAGHRPWYVSTSKCVECQAAFEPLLLEYGVDLVLHGHKHFYERHAAVGKNGTAQEITNNPTAPWYIVNGAAGHYDGLDTPSQPLVATSRKSIVAYGWNLFTVHNCTHLTTEFISSSNNSVLDTATLYKERKCRLD